VINTRAASRLVLVFCLTVSIGCGEEVAPRHPASGKVTLDGAPLGDAEIIYVPDAEKGNKSKISCGGRTAADGTYTLSTVGPAGAPAGWYKVVVQTTFPGGPAKPVVIPDRYASLSETDLSREVVPSPAADAYDIHLNRK
jgi:hypothetical protein